MKQVGFELGLTIPAHRHYIEHLGFIRRDHEKTIDGFLNEFRNIGVRLVIVVLANSSENYGKFENGLGQYKPKNITSFIIFLQFTWKDSSPLLRILSAKFQSGRINY